MDSEERVEGLDFTYGDLSGELPATLGMMSHLRYLHASCNQFVGKWSRLSLFLGYQFFSDSGCRAAYLLECCSLFRRTR